MVNCFVEAAPERDVTVTVTEQRPTRAAIIFVLDTLQSLDDDVATFASTDNSLPVVNPAAAAAFVKVIDVPRFTDGEPTILIGIDTVVAVPFLGVIFIFTMHLPGATPVTFEPDVLHIFRQMTMVDQARQLHRPCRSQKPPARAQRQRLAPDLRRLSDV